MDPVTLGIATGTIGNLVYDGFERLTSDDDTNYISKCVKEAANEVENEFTELSKGELRPILVPQLEDINFETTSDDIDERILSSLNQAILQNTTVSSKNKADKIIEELFIRVEGKIVSRPSIGLPILLERTRDLKLDKNLLIENIQEILDHFEPDLSRLESYTNRNIDEEFSIPGISESIGHSEREEVISIIDNADSVLVHGEAGVGKSGLIVDITREYQTHGPTFFLDARECVQADTPGDLQDILGINHNLSTILGELGENIGECLLVVDQLDNVRGTGSDGVLQTVILECAAQPNVNVLAACRTWDLMENPQYDQLANTLKTVKLTQLTSSQVEEILTQLDINVSNDAPIISLGENLLNLSIIGQLATDQSEVDFEEIKSQVSLWDAYRESLKIRETPRKSDMALNVENRVTELALRSLSEDNPNISIPDPDYEEERLISRGVLRNTRDYLYKFKHDQLRTYFYAWRIFSTSSSEFISTIESDEIPYHLRPSILRWIMLLCQEESSTLAEQFLEEIFTYDTSTFSRIIVLEEIRSWSTESVDESFVFTLFSYLSDRPTFKDYFFVRSGTHGSWAEFLPKSPINLKTSEISDYHKNIAGDSPDIVINNIKSISIEDEDEFGNFVQIFASLPLESITDCIDTMCYRLMNGPIASEEAIDRLLNLTVNLLEEGYEDPAFKLATRLIRPLPVTEVESVEWSGEIKYPFNVSISDLAIDVSELTFQEFKQNEIFISPLEGNFVQFRQPVRTDYVLNRVIPSLADSNLQRTLKLLEGYLRAIGYINEKFSENLIIESEDKSAGEILADPEVPQEILIDQLQYASPRRLPNSPWFMVREGFDNHQTASVETTSELFVYGIIFSLVEERDPTDTQLNQLMERYLSAEPPFHRIALYVLQSQVDRFQEKAKDILLSPEIYRESQNAPELGNLIHMYLRKFPEDSNDILELIETVPNTENEKAVAEWIADDVDGKNVEELTDWLVKHWFTQYFNAIQTTLNSEVRKQYESTTKGFSIRSLKTFRHEVDTFLVENLIEDDNTDLDTPGDLKTGEESEFRDIQPKSEWAKLSPNEQISTWIENEELSKFTSPEIYLTSGATLTDYLSNQLRREPSQYTPHLDEITNASPEYWQFVTRNLSKLSNLENWNDVFDFAETIIANEIEKPNQKQADCGQLAELLGNCDDIQYAQRLRNILIRIPSSSQMDRQGNGLKMLIIFTYNCTFNEYGLERCFDTVIKSVIKYAALSDHPPFHAILGSTLPLLEELEKPFSNEIMTLILEASNSPSEECFINAWNSNLNINNIEEVPMHVFRENATEIFEGYLDDSDISTRKSRLNLYDSLIDGINNDIIDISDEILETFYKIASPHQTHTFASRIHSGTVVVYDERKEVEEQKLTSEKIIDIWRYRIENESEPGKFSNEFYQYSIVLENVSASSASDDLLELIQKTIPIVVHSSGGLRPIIDFLSRINDPEVAVDCLSPLIEQRGSNFRHRFGNRSWNLLSSASDLNEKKRAKAIEIARTIAESGDFEFVELANSLREL